MSARLTLPPKRVNMTGTLANKTGNATEPLNLTAKMPESQKVNMTGTQGNKTGNATEPLNLTAKMHELQMGTQANKTGNTTLQNP